MIHEDEMDAPSSRGPGVTCRVLDVAAVDAYCSYFLVKSRFKRSKHSNGILMALFDILVMS